MKRGYLRPDGIMLKHGDWLAVDTGRNKGIGRFGGVWDNPVIGPMSSLDYFRYFKKPQERTTLFLGLKDGPQSACARLLNSATLVAGPLKSSGKRPPPVERAPEPTIGELVERAHAAGDKRTLSTITKPWTCPCGFKGTILDAVMECDALGHPKGEIGCPVCHSPNYQPHEMKKPHLTVISGGAA